jgi:hypothetical protein
LIAQLKRLVASHIPFEWDTQRDEDPSQERTIFIWAVEDTRQINLACAKVSYCYEIGVYVVEDGTVGPAYASFSTKEQAEAWLETRKKEASAQNYSGRLRLPAWLHYFKPSELAPLMDKFNLNGYLEACFFKIDETILKGFHAGRPVTVRIILHPSTWWQLKGSNFPWMGPNFGYPLPTSRTQWDQLLEA